MCIPLSQIVSYRERRSTIGSLQEEDKLAQRSNFSKCLKLGKKLSGKNNS